MNKGCTYDFDAHISQQEQSAQPCHSSIRHPEQGLFHPVACVVSGSRVCETERFSGSFPEGPQAGDELECCETYLLQQLEEWQVEERDAVNTMK